MLELAMSDHLGSSLSSQVRVGGSVRDAELIPWGSTEALEAIQRICQGVAMRCHQALATHHPASNPDDQL
jgi:hypothetical protein